MLKPAGLELLVFDRPRVYAFFIPLTCTLPGPDFGRGSTLTAWYPLQSKPHPYHFFPFQPKAPPELFKNTISSEHIFALQSKPRPYHFFPLQFSLNTLFPLQF